MSDVAPSFFDWMWKRLEDQGLLPAKGGEEYDRLKQRWIEVGTPDVRKFLFSEIDPHKKDEDVGTD